MKENKWLIVLVVYMFFSIFWSDIPYISFRRWIREFQAVLMAFVVQSEPSPRQAIESILRRTTYILIPFSLLLIRYFPAYGRLYGRWFGEEEWIGVALQKNGLGRLCIIAAFFLIWSLVRRHQGHNPPIWKYQTHTEIFVLVIAFRLLGGPGGYIFSAATAIYAFCAAMLTYWGYSLLKKSGNKMPAGILITVVAIIIIIGIATFFNAASNAKFLASVARRNATLTGRTEIWAKLLPIAIQRPLLGRGFGGFWTSVTRKEIATEGHSGYLDVLLDLGFVGILLVSTFLFSSCLKADRELKRDFDWGVLWIGFLIMAVVHNITESSINSLTSQLIAIILFLTVSSTKIYLPREQT